MDRRRFVRTVSQGAAAGLVAAQAGRVPAQVRQAADVVFLNGVVVTMNAAQPTAEAVAVKGGRIQAVGTLQDIEALCDARTERIDLKGQCLSPGLIDAHSHLMHFGQMEKYFVNLRPPKVHDFATLGRTLAEAAAKTPVGEWVVGRGFNEFDEGRYPFRTELDLAVPRHPVLAIQWSGQYGITNTLGLEKAGLLRRDVPDPYGGKYGRDRTGVPDGRLLHYPAIYSVYQPTVTSGQAVDCILWAADQMARVGVTCVHDNFCYPEIILQYVQLERAGRLPLRLRAYPYVKNLEVCQALVAQARRPTGPLVRVPGVKLAVDGYPLMYEVPRGREQMNIPMHPQDRFEAIISTIHQAGLQVDVHAAGDRGVDLTLDAFIRAAGGDRAVVERRHRIEHYLFNRPASISRTADMGVPVCTQPVWIPYRADDLTRRLGWDMVKDMLPIAGFRKAGVRVSFGADVPASPTHVPLESIRYAMTRQATDRVRLDPSQSTTFLEGLQAHTIDAAYAAFDEKELGSIEVGKWADFTVWNMDLRTVTAANLDALQTVGTYLGGRATARA